MYQSRDAFNFSGGIKQVIAMLRISGSAGLLCGSVGFTGSSTVTIHVYDSLRKR